MKKIFKYLINIEDVQTIKLPISSEILTAQVVKGEPFLYAIVNSDNLIANSNYQEEEINIYIFGTGHPISNYEDLVYISTIQQLGGSLVRHIFKEKK
jgi:hypothetical protein